jgi:hypothetical protein
LADQHEEVSDGAESERSGDEDVLAYVSDSEAGADSPDAEEVSSRPDTDKDADAETDETSADGPGLLGAELEGLRLDEPAVTETLEIEIKILTPQAHSSGIEHPVEVPSAQKDPLELAQELSEASTSSRRNGRAMKEMKPESRRSEDLTIEPVEIEEVVAGESREV